MDEKLYGLLFIGWMVKRLYGYFRNNIAVTDFMHVALGIGILGHIFAFIKGR